MSKRHSLSQTWQRIRTLPGLGRNTVAITVIMALGITALSIIVSNQGYVAPWTSQYVFSADFVQAPGVDPSQKPKVKIAGVDVGYVTEATPTKDGQARLQLSIDPGHTIYQNARIVLRPVNPVNEMYVEINPGGAPAKPLQSDGVIPTSQTQRPVQSDEVLNHLDGRTRTALTYLLSMSTTALAHAPSQLPPGLTATDNTVKQFKPVLDSLQTRRQYIAQLVTSVADISKAAGGNDQRLTELTDGTQKTLNVLGNNDGNLGQSLKELPGMTTQLRNAMTGATQLTGQLNPTLDNLNRATPQLPSTLNHVSNLVGNLGKTVDAAKPVVQQAQPVVHDLSPVVRNVHTSLGPLQPLAKDLGPDTKTIVPYLNDIQAFIFNTSGIFSVNDKNGGMIRGHLAVPLPAGGVLPGAHLGTQIPQGGGK